MKIINLRAENVQRLKAVEIAPGEESVVVVGGNNGHGKTSLLDSIMFALGGKASLSQKPVREGQGSASVEVAVDGFVISKKIYPNGKSELVIKNAEGQIESSPQKLLDSLTSKLTFDPLAFANMEQKQQVEVLKSLIPFDFSAHEKFRKMTYDERTFVNRELKAKTAENEANPYDPSLGVDLEPDTDIAKLIADAATNAASKQTLERNINSAARAIAESEERIEALKSEIIGLELRIEKAKHYIEEHEPKLSNWPVVDVTQLEKAREDLRIKNDRRRKNQEAKQIMAQKLALEAQVNELTEKINKLDEQKITAITNATLPVAGLSFHDDDGVMFAGIPFSQLSGAERLKVSLAMGIALNPQLRVLLIRDGSLLDDENLQVVGEMAKQHNMQVWIERVGKGEECSVIIEDGTIVENRIEHHAEA